MNLKTFLLLTAFSISFTCLPATATSLDTTPAGATDLEQSYQATIDFQADATVTPSASGTTVDYGYVPTAGISGQSYAFSPTVTPEPGTIWLMGSLPLLMYARRKYRA